MTGKAYSAPRALITTSRSQKAIPTVEADWHDVDTFPLNLRNVVDNPFANQKMLV